MDRPVSDFFFTRPPRKLSIIGVAFAVSQLVSLPLTIRDTHSTYLVASLGVFGVACVVLEYARITTRRRRHTRYRTGRHQLVRSAVEVLGTSFELWEDAKISHFLRNRRIVVTGAADEMVSPVLRDLIKHAPAALYLLDKDSLRVENHRRFVVRLAPQLKCTTRIGDLHDYSWLAKTFAEIGPDVVLDLNVYRFLQTHGRAIDHGHYREYLDASKELYARFQAVESVLRAATETISVRSVLMALPKSAREFVIENWLVLQRNLLNTYVRGLGAHITAEDAVVSVWQPSKKSA